jgi:HEAT repeat protein
MKLCYKITICLLLGGLYTQAQTAFLSKMPVKDSASLDSAMQKMSALEEKGLTELAAPTPLKYQYALNSYSEYVTAATHENERAIAIKAYCKALPRVTDPESKAFLITQLQHMGNESAVPTIAPYLYNARLADPAARALAQLDGDNGLAKMALVKALSKATVNCRISIVSALGQLRYLSALDAITAQLQQPDIRLRREALKALALIGNPVSVPVLGAAAAKAGYGPDPANATDSYINLAWQLAYNWPQEPAYKIAVELMQHCTADSLIHVRIAALNIIVYIKQDEAIPTLQNAVINGPAPYRAAALRLAAKHMSSTNIRQWMSKEEFTNGEAKAAIITLLGQSHQQMVLPVFTKDLNDTSAIVRLAAVQAMGNIASLDIITPLLFTLKTADTTLIPAIIASLNRLKGQSLTERIGTSLRQEPPAAQLGLLQILADRKADDQWMQLVLLYQQHQPAVQQATLQTLDKIGGKPLLQQAASKLEDSDQAGIRAYLDAHYK